MRATSSLAPSGHPDMSASDAGHFSSSGHSTVPRSTGPRSTVPHPPGPHPPGPQSFLEIRRYGLAGLLVLATVGVQVALNPSPSPAFPLLVSLFGVIATAYMA